MPLLFPVQTAKIASPGPGTPLRATLLDVIRPYAFKKNAAKRKLRVGLVRTDGTAALVRCTPIDEDKAMWSARFSYEGDLTTFFLRRANGRWRLLGSLSDFHEGGLISVWDLRGLKRHRFPIRLLEGADEFGLRFAARGWTLWAVDERLQVIPISDADADALLRAGDNAKLRGRPAQITRFRPA